MILILWLDTEVDTDFMAGTEVKLQDLTTRLEVISRSYGIEISNETKEDPGE